MEQQKTILFVASSPSNSTRDRLDAEVRNIQEGLTLSKYRDRFIFKTIWATTPKDLQRAILNLEPAIVHFSGHGDDGTGLSLEDGQGQAKPVTAEALSKLFQLFQDCVECVVLNACYSQVQAEAIAQHIPYTIGMDQAIGEKAAIEFAVGFYDGLGAGRDIEFAFKLARNRIDLESLPGSLVPVLLGAGQVAGAELSSRPQTAITQQAAPEIAIAHLPSAVTHFMGRDKELAQLDQAWDDPNTPLISLVAFGGVGKSALVAAWLERLRKDKWRGAQYVLGHSFYSQGSREDAQVSAADFIDRALRFLGDPTPEAGSAWDKGERLARLMRKTKTLLVLDGMEPMQWGADSVEVGRIKDQGLAALVRELAVDNNAGLCVITTRQAVADMPTAAKIDLEALSDRAGASLLRALGVNGLQPELEAASRQVQGHGLALRLLGTYLKKVCNGDVRRMGEVDLSRVDQRLGGHAHRLVEKYERWLGDGVELSILRLLGLFDRPAERDCLAAVCAAPAIPGLTDALVELTVEDCQWAVSNLIDYGLLSPETLADQGMQPVAKSQFSILNCLDAHPLIREYFATQLAGQYSEATKEAHRRLYEHLKQVAPELPDTLQGMMPLYHAMGHGGKAGLWQEALDDVFYARIERQGGGFSRKKLGAMGTDLAALTVLFEVPFSHPNPNLTEQTQAYVLSSASFRLRALGRLAEATQPMQVGLEREVARNDWKNAAVTASNLSELYLTLGDVAAAVQVGEQAVELSDRSGDSFHRMANRTTLADALHQAARLQSAHGAFREAETLQAEGQPEYPLLYSTQGFCYCDLLLERGLLEPGEAVASHRLEQPSAETGASSGEVSSWLARCGEVRERAEYALEEANDKDFLLDAGLDNISLGRTYFLEATLRHKNPVESISSDDLTILLQQATHHLNQSVSLLRQAGAQEFITRGLLARAALWRVSSQVTIDHPPLPPADYLENAHRDLTEAEQIAGRSHMLIFQIEAALERCRLALAVDDKTQARSKLDEAKALVKQTERPYVPHVPTWDGWEPPEYVGLLKEGEMVGYYRRNGEIAELAGEIG
ncbi:AAA family ATPase [Leptothoe kymatousa]|uniref:AAA family ATPase n=1 Tax=Leptothoe kymatousa TAU-MAC 1615 TaxID=2364775 RepID=A0ABS5XZR2_9CYAN|nr:AAA family ATPase [Leptothoe kymatousa]MBT9311079.1 AAA family ATPase [Leptothoe kymatousa TAU-MAC 1615]